MVKIDNIDVNIFHILLENARLKVSEIANKSGLTSPGVKYRLEKLKKLKVIINSGLSINMANFGYHHPVLIGLNVESNQKESIIKFVNKYAKVAGINETIGKYNLCLFVFAKSVNSIDELKHCLKKMEGVINIDINVWTKFHLNYSNIDIQNMK